MTQVSLNTVYSPPSPDRKSRDPPLAALVSIDLWRKPRSTALAAFE